MATREVHIPGIYSGLPFGRVVELQEFADKPLRDCLLCSRRGRASDRTQGYFGVDAKRNASTLVGGGEFRHCCRRQWRYAADNYYSRELCGFASLAELPFGDVNKTHGDEASRRLDAFDAVLITERLNEARPVLAAKLGWRLPRDVAVPWRNKGATRRGRIFRGRAGGARGAQRYRSGGVRAGARARSTRVCGSGGRGGGATTRATARRVYAPCPICRPRRT